MMRREWRTGEVAKWRGGKVAGWWDGEVMRMRVHCTTVLDPLATYLRNNVVEQLAVRYVLHHNENIGRGVDHLSVSGLVSGLVRDGAMERECGWNGYTRSGDAAYTTHSVHHPNHPRTMLEPCARPPRNRKHPCAAQLAHADTCADTPPLPPPTVPAPLGWASPRIDV